jgi:hypothetical protein
MLTLTVRELAIIILYRSENMGFATKRDFENALALNATTRREKRDKAALIAKGVAILQAARDEPQTVLKDLGPKDPGQPDGEHDYEELPVENPIWKQYGFESMEDAIAMLVRFEAVV